MSILGDLYDEDIAKLKKELVDAKEKCARVIEDGCPTKKASGKPCFACQQAAARVRAS